MTVHLTDTEHQQIADLFWSMVDDGKPPTVKAVAAGTGRSTKAVKRSLERSRIVRPAARVTTVERERIIQLYLTRRNGKWLSTGQVGKLVGRGATTVFAVVKEAGVLRTRSEAAAHEVPEETRQRVLALRRATGWGWEKVSAALKVKPTVVRKVFEEANVFVPAGPNSRAKVTPEHAELIVGLYEQGQPIDEVARRTGRDKTTITTVLRGCGVELRPFSEANSLAQYRLADRRRLARVDIMPLAERWLAGCEVEDLAAELPVAADLLWDKLAEAIAEMRPPAAIDDSGRCAGCPFACAAMCAYRNTPVIVPKRPPEPPPEPESADSPAPLSPDEVAAGYRWTGTRYTKIPTPPKNPQVNGKATGARGGVTFGPTGFGWTIH